MKIRVKVVFCSSNNLNSKTQRLIQQTAFELSFNHYCTKSSTNKTEKPINIFLSIIFSCCQSIYANCLNIFHTPRQKIRKLYNVILYKPSSVYKIEFKVILAFNFAYCIIDIILYSSRLATILANYKSIKWWKNYSLTCTSAYSQTSISIFTECKTTLTKLLKWLKN